MLKRLLAMLIKDTQAKAPAKKSASSQNSPTKPKIESTRIGELGEHKINIQLDQLPKDCRHLHDLMIPNDKSRTKYSQIDHVVVSPYGIFVIETKNYQGEIKGAREDRNWWVSKRFRMYNPIMQNSTHIKGLQALLSNYPNLKFISLISFTMRCRFRIDPGLRKIQSDELVVYDVELSEFIQRKLLRIKAESAVALSNEDVARIHEVIRRANIEDPNIRREHIEKISGKRA